MLPDRPDLAMQKFTVPLRDRNVKAAWSRAPVLPEDYA